MSKQVGSMKVIITNWSVFLIGSDRCGVSPAAHWSYRILENYVEISKMFIMQDE